MSLSSHVAELKKKHAQLEAELAAEQRSPGSDDLQLREMKKQKLRIKEEISRLSA